MKRGFVRSGLFLLAMGGCILALVLTGEAKDAPAGDEPSLQIKPIRASYIEREGNVLSLAFWLTNGGDREITVVTEHLNYWGGGVNKKTGSLESAVQFKDDVFAPEGGPVIPSIYKHAPVTLYPGESTIVHYVRDYSTAINGPGVMNEADLKAETVIIAYEVSQTWGERFDLWHGCVTAEPIKFDKRLRAE